MGFGILMTATLPQPANTRSQFPVVLDARVVTGPGGGPDKTILNSPRFFASAGYRVLCAYMHPPGDPGFDQLRDKAKAWNAPLLSVPDRGPWDWRVISRLVEICRGERVHIWHGHDYKSNALGLVVRRFWPMHLVTTVHGWVRNTLRTPLYYMLDRLCLPHYESVICVSGDLHEQCIRAGVPAHHCVLIENGIDTDEYQRRQTKVQAKERLGVPPRRLVVGAVGRLSPEKGFDNLIRALQGLLARGLDVELLIAGEGDERLHLQKLSTDLGMGERVRFLGYQSDTRKIYEAMDVFALSSIREGLPNVLLEAMAMEVPVVATRIAGIPQLIADGENGLLVEPGSEAQLTEVLAGLLSDESFRITLQAAGRRTVEARYSFTGRIQKIQMIYDGLLYKRSK
jgi:glycosyltransferase involved in cell wall biosynthesis